jgi:hypothetical protein
MIRLEGSPKAPKGCFRLILIDVFDGDGWVERDDKSLRFVIQMALKDCVPRSQDCHVHDDKGRLLFDAADIVGKDEKVLKLALDSLIEEKLLVKSDKIAILKSYRRHLVLKAAEKKKIERMAANMRRKIHRMK